MSGVSVLFEARLPGLRKPPPPPHPSLSRGGKNDWARNQVDNPLDGGKVAADRWCCHRPPSRVAGCQKIGPTFETFNFT